MCDLVIKKYFYTQWFCTKYRLAMHENKHLGASSILHVCGRVGQPAEAHNSAAGLNKIFCNKICTFINLNACHSAHLKSQKTSSFCICSWQGIYCEYFLMSGEGMANGFLRMWSSYFLEIFTDVTFCIKVSPVDFLVSYDVNFFTLEPPK